MKLFKLTRSKAKLSVIKDNLIGRNVSINSKEYCFRVDKRRLITSLCNEYLDNYNALSSIALE